MEEAMSGDLAVTTEWERLVEGAREQRALDQRTPEQRPLDGASPEERACFAALGIRWNEVWLTEGRDGFIDVIRNGPYLSGYHLAQWMAWNWWRLRWEPRSTSDSWAFAHRMATIGEGYVWPNITIFSDGERVAVIAKPSSPRQKSSFRYINDVVAVIPATQFESVADEFVERIRGKLRAEGIVDTNLDRIWIDVTEERSDPEIARRRKLEALLGFDPDDADDDMIERLIRDAEPLGQAAVEEVAADRADGGDLPSAEALREIAERGGFEASPRDAIRLAPRTALPQRGQTPAWRLGAEAAKALRAQQRLDGQPISDERLARMAGVSVEALNDLHGTGGMAYAIDESAMRGRVVLRSRWRAGRRFEVARLLGDRLVGGHGAGALFPATRAYTYRQKMQRAFAAELLSPFHAVDDMLDGDYSEERQQDAAEHFRVSEQTIWTVLANHGRIDREPGGEFDSAPA